jgi:hypothetical protein
MASPAIIGGIVAAVGAVAGASISAAAQNSSAKRTSAAQKQAAQMQQEQSDRDYSRQMAQMRQANQTTPDITSLLDANTQGEQGGASLTGAGGSAVNSGNLTGSNLLGG